MYDKLVNSKIKEVINEHQSNYTGGYNFLYTDINKIFNGTKNPEVVFNSIIYNYLKSVDSISKLSPGLSTCLFDIKNNININTYSGTFSDTDFSLIDDNTVFDVSSITKLFTAILLLIEEEKGNIDLSRNFSNYSIMLNSLNTTIIDALKFGVEIRTSGRLDSKNLPAYERINRLLNSYVYKYNTFKYSDVPYMLVPLLFGDTIRESSDIFLDKFNDLYSGLGLKHTGYNYDNMTGGFNGQLYDPKAKYLVKDGILIPGHAGITTNVEDLKKLFELLYNGLLNQESISKLITPINPEKMSIIDDGRTIYKNRGMSVYANINDRHLTDISPRYSKNAFSASGSTGTYSVFDLDNGYNVSILSNIKSTSQIRTINTEDYLYGDCDNFLSQNKDVVVLGGNNSKNDGTIVYDNERKMPYYVATSNFKEECLNTLIKLRIAKKILIDIYGESLDISKTFNRNFYMDKEKKLILK